MTDKLITGLLMVVAIIHLLPIVGVTGAARLEGLYGIPIGGGDLEILMRHRAVLFGILGLFLAYAAFTPSMQPLAFLAALASLASFFYLAFSVGGFGEGVRKVVIADVVAAVSLAGAVALYYLRGSG